MKLSQDSRLIRKIAENIRELNDNASIQKAVSQAYEALDLVRDAEYRVQNDYYDKED
jgi:predicted GTPase